MLQVTITRAGEIPARPEVVYSILADYREHHPRILPKEFTGLEVLAGGIGAGTEARVTMRVAGRDSAFRLLVDEPEPGRVLRERDPDSGLVTTFTVTPLGADRAQLQITTAWDRKAGPAGWVEAQITKLLMGSIYNRELGLLAEYAASRQAGAP